MLARLHEAEMPLRQGERGVAGIAPSTGRPSAAIASRTKRSWRGLPTWLRITPATRTSRVVGREARASAAADCDWPDTSRTRRRGAASAPRCRRWRRSRLSARTPSNSPMTPSTMRTSEAAAASAASASIRSGRHRPAVEIDAWASRGRRHGRQGRYSRARTSRPAREPAPRECRQERRASPSSCPRRSSAPIRSGRARAHGPRLP